MKCITFPASPCQGWDQIIRVEALRGDYYGHIVKMSEIFKKKIFSTPQFLLRDKLNPLLLCLLFLFLNCEISAHGTGLRLFFEVGGRGLTDNKDVNRSYIFFKSLESLE